MEDAALCQSKRGRTLDSVIYGVHVLVIVVHVVEGKLEQTLVFSLTCVFQHTLRDSACCVERKRCA